MNESDYVALAIAMTLEEHAVWDQLRYMIVRRYDYQTYRQMGDAYNNAACRDYLIMHTAVSCPLARYTNSRGDVSMVRLNDDWYALRRKYDPVYSEKYFDLF